MTDPFPRPLPKASMTVALDETKPTGRCFMKGTIHTQPFVGVGGKISGTHEQGLEYISSKGLSGRPPFSNKKFDGVDGDLSYYNSFQNYNPLGKPAFENRTVHFLILHPGGYLLRYDAPIQGKDEAPSVDWGDIMMDYRRFRPVKFPE